MSTEHYDVIVIGSGQAGGPLATAFARDGRKVALIEREHVGGTCINVGCTPTKTMVASARVAHLARRGEDYGVGTGPVRVNMARVRQRKRDMVERFRTGSQRHIQGTKGVDVIFGEASFSGPKSVEVRLGSGETRRLTGELIFINTGDRPAIPQIPGLSDVPFLDSTTIMELDEVPEHLIVLGGGYIGLEFGQMFRRFGSRVTIVQRGERLVPREDADVSDAIAQILREDGVEVLVSAKAARVGCSRKAVQVGVEVGGKQLELLGSHLLVAAGRTPNTEDLHLEAAGIAVDKRGNVVVDERLATNVPGVYALGDVKGGPAFTHISYDDFRIVRTNLIEGGDATIAGRLVPLTIFTDPELARVGLTEGEARSQGRAVKVAKMPMSRVARALEMDEPRGVMKGVVDAETGQILGFTVLGVMGGELMSMVEVAMMGRLPYTVLRDAILVHPTLAESLNNLFAGIRD